MKRLARKLWMKFITWFGNIKVFKYPFFIVYDPSFFKMDGCHTMKAIQLLEPGDVILRGFDNYLDGYFIDDPHGYSHGAIYVGKEKIIHAVVEGVSEINVLDFMKCDRICILRPTKYKQQAISKAKKFLQENVPYDFSFKSGASALYCFELVAECYAKLNPQKIEFKKIFGLLTRSTYLADSFRENSSFKTVFEYNPKHKIDK